MPHRPEPSPDSTDSRLAHRALVASAIFLAVTFLALFVWYSVYVLFLLFAGVLLAILLRALADAVRHFSGLSHRLSLAIVLLVLGVGLGLFWWVAASSLTKQAMDLSEQLPEAWAGFQERVRATPIGKMVMGAGEATAATQPSAAGATPPAPSAGPPSGGGGFRMATGELLGRFGGFLTTLMDVVAALVVVLFTGMFLAFDPTLYVRGAIRLIPPGYRERGGEVIGAIGYTLKWWLIGQGITMVVIATATWIGLMILGVPLALVLGVIAGLFNFIPNFGPLFSMVPATLLALTISPGTAVGVIILFMVLQNLEGNLLTPLIQRKAVDLPPAIGIIAQILLGILVGAVGLMLAWPLAAAVVVAVKMLYVEDVLGDEIPTPDDQMHKEVRQAKREARDIEQDEKKPAEPTPPAR
jgi:predicted PurR-regulated permease PerM